MAFDPLPARVHVAKTATALRRSEAKFAIADPWGM
jgi:hypothetical protein